VLGWFDANLVSILNGFAIGSLLFILAVGLSIVFGMMDVLNLAHGALYLAGAYLGFQFAGTSSWSGFLTALGVAALVGLLAGGVLSTMTQPLARRPHLDQALLTLGVALVVAELLWGFGMVAFEVFFPARLAEVSGGTDDAAGLVGVSVAAAWVLSALGAAVAPMLVRRVGAGWAACSLRLATAGRSLRWASPPVPSAWSSPISPTTRRTGRRRRCTTAWSIAPSTAVSVPPSCRRTRSPRSSVARSAGSRSACWQTGRRSRRR